MKQPVILVDIFADIVNKVQTAWRLQTGDPTATVNYMYGPVEEIEANLIEIAQAEGLNAYTGPKKYPLIALFQDFPEDRPGPGGYYATVNIPIILIATLSQPQIKAQERYNTTLKPILYPLYGLLLHEIGRSGKLSNTDPSEIPHRKFDRLYYGRKTLGTGVSDYVDAIELQNIRLTVKQFCG